VVSGKNTIEMQMKLDVRGKTDAKESGSWCLPSICVSDWPCDNNTRNGFGDLDSAAHFDGN